jgi:hypothetical protein
MRKRLSTILLSGAAVLLTITMGAPTALAAGATWTVTPGGAFTGVTYRIVVTDTTTGTKFTCADTGKINFSGNFQAGSGLANPIGYINRTVRGRHGAGWGCTGSGSVWTMITLAEEAPYWQFQASHYDASTGVTTGQITGIDASVYTSAVSGCFIGLDGTGRYAEDGKIRFRYTNSDSELSLLPGGDLNAVYVNDCPDVSVNQGDRMTIAANFTLTAAQTISSP